MFLRKRENGFGKARGLKWMLKAVLGQCKAEKGCCQRKTVKGIERHIKKSLIKAWLGSFRLAHLSASYHWEPLLKAE